MCLSGCMYVCLWVCLWVCECACAHVGVCEGCTGRGGSKVDGGFLYPTVLHLHFL